MKYAVWTLAQFFNPRVLFSAGIVLFVVGLPSAKSGFVGRPTRSEFLREADPSRPKDFSCLPKDVRLDEVLSPGIKGRPSVTVKRELVELKARCHRGKLVNARGREIRFFRSSCWGNPPPDYLEIRQRENGELAKLQKRYAVVVFGCNPMIQ
jgi:hypothetical protein